VTAEHTPREIDLRAIDLTQLLRHAEEVIAAAAAGESITVLAGHEVVLSYLAPTAATNGLRCRFGPPKDGVWRIELSPRQAPAATEPDARKEP
jgi:hypothetical protein